MVGADGVVGPGPVGFSEMRGLVLKPILHLLRGQETLRTCIQMTNVRPNPKIGKFIQRREPFILSTHHEHIGIPQISAHMTFNNIFSKISPSSDHAYFQHILDFPVKIAFA